MMKKYLFLIIVFFYACKRKEEKLVSTVNVNYVSIGTKYGKLYKYFTVHEIVNKNDNYTMFIYEDTMNFKRIDTLKLYSNGKVIFNNIKADKIQTKKIVSSKIVFVHKIYVTHKVDFSVDDFSGEIIYFSVDGIIARYGTASNYISLYKPDVYNEIHDGILYRKFDFKRHPEELEGKP